MPVYDSLQTCDDPPQELLRAADELNILLNTDPVAMDWIVKYQVKCNEAMANVDNLPVQLNNCVDGPFYSTGIIGLLNLLLSSHPYYIVADFEDDCVMGFRVAKY